MTQAACSASMWGWSFYTLGQRKGIGIGGVKEKKSARGGGDHEPRSSPARTWEKNTLWIVQGHDHPWLQSHQLRAGDISWVADEAPTPGVCAAKTRYRQADARCRIDACNPADGSFGLHFDEAQWAVTPGQSAVVYDGVRCVWAAASSRRRSPDPPQSHPGMKPPPRPRPEIPPRQDFVISTRQSKNPSDQKIRGVCWNRSLTMTYFHTRMRTIIGAGGVSPSCSGWEGGDHLAMVVRHNCWSFRMEPERQFVESVSESALVCQLIAFTVTEVRFTSTLLP